MRAVMIGMGVVWVFALGLACEHMPFGPFQCKALVSIAEDLAVDIQSDTLSSKERAKMAEKYTRTAARIADLGCEFVPPPGAPTS